MKTKSKIGVYVILCMVVSLAFAQAPDTLWTKRYGGGLDDLGNSVQQTNDLGYIIAGIGSFGAGNNDIWLIKTDINGDTMWTKIYGGTGRDEGYSVQQTNDFGYIIAGYTQSYGAGMRDFYLIKTDSLGDSLWTKTYGGTARDEGYSVQQTMDFGYIIAGRTQSFGAGNWDIYLIKTDSLGNPEWDTTFGGTGYDGGESVQQTNDYGYIIVGTTQSYGAGLDDIYLIKTDSLGNLEWDTIFGGTGYDRGYSVQQTWDLGYIIAGEAEYYGTGDDADVYLIKTDSLGNLEWDATFGDTLVGDAGYSVQQTNDLGYIIAGTTGSFGTNNDSWLIKTDSLGNLEWDATFGGLGHDEGYAVQQTNDFGYIIAGYTEFSGNDVYLIKVEALFTDVHPITIDIPDTLDEATQLTPQAKVKNSGAAIETFEVTCTINPGGYLSTITVVDLYPYQSRQITFDSVFAFETGSYTVTVYTYLLDDMDTSNDTLEKVIVTHDPGITEGNSDQVFSFGLRNNPAKGKALFNLTLPEAATVSLRIYDVSGRLISNISEHKPAGYYQIPWETKVNGIYFYTFETSGHKETGKLVMLH